MKKRILIPIMCLLLMIPVMSVMAGESLLSGGGSVEAGGSTNFRVNLGAVPEEYGAYTLTIKISPAPAGVSVAEGVNMSENLVNGTFTVSSADLSSVTALNFTVTTSADLTSDTTYSVSASVNAEAGSISDGLSFTAKAAAQKEEPAGDDSGDEEQNTDPSQQNGGQSGGMPSGGSGFSGGSYSGGSISSGSFSGGSFSGGSIGGTTDTSLVYKGSADNYLTELSVEGYEFTKEFNKTRNTYFVHVKADTSELNVTAKGDSSADISIAGSDSVSEDMSKIQINVTADNGEVRVYRIYVTHDMEE